MQINFLLSTLLIPYVLFLLIIMFFMFFNIRNLVRYRAENRFSFIALFIFISGIIIISYITYTYLAPVNWKETIDIGFNIGNGSF